MSDNLFDEIESCDLVDNQHVEILGGNRSSPLLIDLALSLNNALNSQEVQSQSNIGLDGNADEIPSWGMELLTDHDSNYVGRYISEQYVTEVPSDYYTIYDRCSGDYKSELFEPSLDIYIQISFLTNIKLGVSLVNSTLVPGLQNLPLKMIIG